MWQSDEISTTGTGNLELIDALWSEILRVMDNISKRKDDSEWSQISDIIKESIKNKGLSREDLEKIIKETEFKTRL